MRRLCAVHNVCAADKEERSQAVIDVLGEDAGQPIKAESLREPVENERGW
jgi:hypothetical protein